jgi:hypothetical protein
MKRVLLLGFLFSASSCHRRPSVTYFDFSARTDVPNGVDAGLETSDEKPLVDWGAFSGSSIVIASDYPMPDTVLIDWTEDGKKVYDQRLVLRQLLPPIDPRRQKYNAQFWFRPGGRVEVKVDTVPIGDCSYTDSFGKTSIPQYGPCSVTGKW